MMTHQRVARRGAIALHHVEHARRNARFEGQLAQTVGGQRGEFRHLQHRGVTQRETGRDLPVAVINGTFHGDTSAQTPTGCEV